MVVYDLFITEGVRFEEVDGKKKVAEKKYEGNSSLEWAGKSANRMKFDEGFDMTAVYATTKLVWDKETKSYAYPAND